MPPARQLIAGLAVLTAFALAPVAAHAASYDPNGFQFSQANFSVHENAGYAVITVTRRNAAREARAYYVGVGLSHPCGDRDCNAVPARHAPDPADFGATGGSLDFAPGVTSMTFNAPIVDHHFASINKTVQLAIFNAWNEGIADQSHAVLTILNDDPSAPRDPNNPLDLPVAPTNGDPLSGARFFIDPFSPPAQAAHGNPMINMIASQPQTARFGDFSGPDAGFAVERFLVRAAAEQPGTVPMLSTYRIVDGHCGNWTPTPGDQARYHDFITRFAQGIGSYRAVLYLEMDSLITSPCLTPQGLQIRLSELHDAIDVLTANCPHLVIYLDAGAADAVPPAQTARLLRGAGVGQIQGFFLNSTHFDWTSNEIRFGERVSKLTGGAHFVINTGENGQGPLVPPDRVHQGNEVLCNPPSRGLGPRPSADTGFINLDAFAWTSNPGESGGPCVPGAPATGAYWPGLAVNLIEHANFNVDHTVAISARLRRHKTHGAKPAKLKHAAKRA